MNRPDNNTEMQPPRDPQTLERRIGYVFVDKSLLAEALTHSSYANEHGGPHRLRCNERLEFLGDSVLSVITSEYIFAKYTDSPEGDLTRMRAELVCERALADFASELELGDYLMLGKGEDKGGGRERKSILADAFEALLAAVYLDAGSDSSGKAAVRGYLMPFIDEKLSKVLTEWRGADYKSLLQQLVQSSGGEVLEYVTVDESGPDHDKVFTVEARLNSNIIGKGSGGSKRAAEQDAARQALALFGEA